MIITLQHPNKSEPPVEVEDTSELLPQLMVQGYTQVHKVQPTEIKSEPKPTISKEEK